MKIVTEYSRDDVIKIINDIIKAKDVADSIESYYVSVPFITMNSIFNILYHIVYNWNEFKLDSEAQKENLEVSSETPKESCEQISPKTFDCFGDNKTDKCYKCKNYVFSDCINCIGRDIKELCDSVKRFDTNVIYGMSASYYGSKVRCILDILYCILGDAGDYPRCCNECENEVICKNIINRFPVLNRILNEKKSKIL